jgi:hypothetical protein
VSFVGIGFVALICAATTVYSWWCLRSATALLAEARALDRRANERLLEAKIRERANRHELEQRASAEFGMFMRLYIQSHQRSEVS